MKTRYRVALTICVATVIFAGFTYLTYWLNSQPQPSTQYIITLNDHQATIVVDHGNWTAILPSSNHGPKMFTSSNYTEVVEWAKYNTRYQEPYVTQTIINGTTYYLGVDPNKYVPEFFINLDDSIKNHVVFSSTNASFVIQSMINEYGIKP